LSIIFILWQEEASFQHLKAIQQLATAANGVWSKPNVRRKTKIVCTVSPSANTREMIWKLAEAGMNVARLNMSHGDHASHQKVIDLVKDYNASHGDNVIAIMFDTKVSVTFSTACLLNHKMVLILRKKLSLKNEKMLSYIVLCSISLFCPFYSNWFAYCYNNNNNQAF
jgi:cytochrome bd-type quinol oxidase subunit 1